MQVEFADQVSRVDELLQIIMFITANPFSDLEKCFCIVKFADDRGAEFKRLRSGKQKIDAFFNG